MSTQNGFTETVVSTANLSATTNLGRGVNTAGALCNAGADFLGILTDGGLALGSPVAVIVAGPARGQAGAAVAAGDYLTTDANGLLIPVAAANQRIVAVAQQGAGAINVLFDVIVTQAQASNGAP